MQHARAAFEDQYPEEDVGEMLEGLEDVADMQPGNNFHLNCFVIAFIRGDKQPLIRVLIQKQPATTQPISIFMSLPPPQNDGLDDRFYASV